MMLFHFRWCCVYALPDGEGVSVQRTTLATGDSAITIDGTPIFAGFRRIYVGGWAHEVVPSPSKLLVRRRHL